jgi:hypothetical protein
MEGCVLSRFVLMLLGCAAAWFCGSIPCHFFRTLTRTGPKEGWAASYPTRLTFSMPLVPLSLCMWCVALTCLCPSLCVRAVSGGELEAPRDGRAGAGAARHRVGV